MSVSYHERIMFETKVGELSELDIQEWASRSFTDSRFLLTLIKAIQMALPNDDLSVQWNDREILVNSLLAKQRLQESLNLLMQNATSSSQKTTAIHPGYSTGELAKFFGVSQTTINNWIKDGRFKDVKRTEMNKQVRIQEDTWYTSTTGATYQVKDIVKAWEDEQKEWESIPIVTDAELIATYIKHFEDKYKGLFEDTLGSHDWGELTDEEETDASMWSFFLERYLNGPK